jgi:hypothetical protein
MLWLEQFLQLVWQLCAGFHDPQLLDAVTTERGSCATNAACL